ncbi:hypothetical protein FBU59_004779, partial [Linderina macrospora]
MAQRSRIPTRRGANSTSDENKFAGAAPTAAAHATGKHIEATKASLRPRAATVMGAAAGKNLNAGPTKIGNGKPAVTGLHARPRNALGEVSSIAKVHDSATTKIVKPGEVTARLHTMRAGSRLARPGQQPSLPKPPLGHGPRARQAGGPMRPSAAAPRPSSIVGARPISKPIGPINSRRLRITSTGSSDDGLPSKRVKSDEATRDLVPSAHSLLGKHPRNGVRATGHHVAAAAKSIERAHLDTHDEIDGLDLEPEREYKISNHGQHYHRRTYSSDAEM